MPSDAETLVVAGQTAAFDVAGTSSPERHVAAARERFASLRSRIAALDRLATYSDVRQIETLDDLARLLFPHALYKSYSSAVLERGGFTQLTDWLAQLTTVDLTRVDMTGVRTFDEWIERLDEVTELRVVHSFGTKGKLSLIPRSRNDWLCGGALIADCVRTWKDDGYDRLGSGRMPFVQPFYRRGASAANRGVETLLELFGDERSSLFLFPNERFSADMAAFAGRLAATRGGNGVNRRDLSTSLPDSHERFANALRRRPQQLQEFLDSICGSLAGRDVYLFGVWPTLYEWAEQGLARGIRNVFGSQSILHTGGGTKGVELPNGWQERIFEFLGFDTYYEFYTMTELIPACPRCEAGNYHVPSSLIPMVLDVETGRPLPRDGTRSGRFAFFDLSASSYWGGFITGDCVTISGWDAPCGCGRAGPHVLPDIRRLGESTGGDDKVNCADTSRAYADALDYVASASARPVE